MPTKLRDYRKLAARIKKLDKNKVKVMTIGKVSGHPIYCVKIFSDKNNKNVLISGGIHGDEPAGPEAILRLLEKKAYKSWAKKTNFEIIPCINPAGYEAGTRENAKGVDINRSFVNNKAIEAVVVKDFLKGKKFDLFIEFHEDWEYDGFYLYEIYRGKLQKDKFGTQIIKKLKANGFSIHRGVADGNPTRGGIVQVGNRINRLSKAPPVMPLYVYKHNSDHVITCESPSKIELELRIKMHLIALNVAMSRLSKKLG